MRSFGLMAAAVVAALAEVDGDYPTAVLREDEPPDIRAMRQAAAARRHAADSLYAAEALVAAEEKRARKAARRRSTTLRQ